METKNPLQFIQFWFVKCLFCLVIQCECFLVFFFLLVRLSINRLRCSIWASRVEKKEAKGKSTTINIQFWYENWRAFLKMGSQLKEIAENYICFHLFWLKPVHGNAVHPSVDLCSIPTNRLEIHFHKHHAFVISEFNFIARSPLDGNDMVKLFIELFWFSSFKFIATQHNFSVFRASLIFFAFI